MVDIGPPHLQATVDLPPTITKTETVEGEILTYGGDVRVGDLDGDGTPEFVVYRSVADGLKPAFLAAVDLDGTILWKVGKPAAGQPARPGPVTVFDIDGDGADEVIWIRRDPGSREAESLADMQLELRDGKTGEQTEAHHPERLDSLTGSGANWVHQRLLVANVTGGDRPQSFICKFGNTVIAFGPHFQVQWSYEIPGEWADYGTHTAYVPAVGDIDGDGLDEILGGKYLLDPDGTPRWEKDLAEHMDSVEINRWNGHQRAFCSGGGHVMTADGETVCSLGTDTVPHGQELRVADFAGVGRSMVIRHQGHDPAAILISESGTIQAEFELNDTPNHTGMLDIRWQPSGSLLYNGGRLWLPDGSKSVALPTLEEPVGPEKMGWHHAIPIDLDGDGLEELVCYNPWSARITVFGQEENGSFNAFQRHPRQYNPRLMD